MPGNEVRKLGLDTFLLKYYRRKEIKSLKMQWVSGFTLCSRHAIELEEYFSGKALNHFSYCSDYQSTRGDK